jgi:hypothetical protein
MIRIKKDIVFSGFRLEKELLIEFKKRAAAHNISLSRWILQAAAEKMAQEDKYK